MSRKLMRSGKDHKIFNRTAKKTKTMNISPKMMRGGIRL